MYMHVYMSVGVSPCLCNVEIRVALPGLPRRSRKAEEMRFETTDERIQTHARTQLLGLIIVHLSSPIL